MNADVDRAGQQWWHSNTPKERFGWPRFVDFDDVYGSGEFTWAGLWTVTDPPAETHDELVSVWEMWPAPVSRWQLPVRSDAHVFEIHRPDDWVRLVKSYPRVATGVHGGWELPGRKRPGKDVRFLLSVPGQNAARVEVGRHVRPDWAAVAADYDGVHLSWAGFISTEGYVCDLEDGAATMLRYWGSERPLWLANVFDDSVPLAQPSMSGRIGGDRGVDVRSDKARQHQDRAVLTAMLAR